MCSDDDADPFATVRTEFEAFVGQRPITGGMQFSFYDEFDYGPTPQQLLANRVPPFSDEQPDYADLLRKAHRGDSAALYRLAVFTRSLCWELELLARKNKSLARGVACTFSDWPMVVSPKWKLSPQERELLNRLDVGGEHAFLPAYSRKRGKPTDLWGRYATTALQCLRCNQQLIPRLLKECANAKCFPVRFDAMKTALSWDYYDVGSKIIVIEGWQRQCADLPPRLTKENAAKFMAVATPPIRWFWHCNPRYFQAVRKKARSLVRHETLGEYFDCALKQIGQAMRGLAHKA